MKKPSKTTKPPAPAPAPAPAAAPKIVEAPRVLKPVALARAASAGAAPAAAATVITAKVDVGFGNMLYLRGSGPGLSWDKGIPLDCVGDAQWTVSLRGAVRPVAFKFLLNDESWCLGADYIAAPGIHVTLTPSF